VVEGGRVVVGLAVVAGRLVVVRLVVGEVVVAGLVVGGTVAALVVGGGAVTVFVVGAVLGVSVVVDPPDAPVANALVRAAVVLGLLPPKIVLVP